MLHKPTYCCNCGDKVERIEWHIWNSRRFCELCETEYQFDEWWPRFAVFGILIFGFTGIGFHFGNEEKPPVVTSTAAVPQNARSLKQESVAETNAKPGLTADENVEPNDQKILDSANPAVGLEKKADPKPVGTAKAVATPETIYYCGALTKKGTQCARRVKDGGKCWQHKDKAAP